MEKSLPYQLHEISSDATVIRDSIANPTYRNFEIYGKLAIRQVAFRFDDL